MFLQRYLSTYQCVLSNSALSLLLNHTQIAHHIPYIKNEQKHLGLLVICYLSSLFNMVGVAYADLCSFFAVDNFFSFYIFCFLGSMIKNEQKHLGLLVICYLSSLFDMVGVAYADFMFFILLLIIFFPFIFFVSLGA